jgi:hypothetical protein
VTGSSDHHGGPADDDDDTLDGLSAGAADDIPLEVPSGLSNSGYIAGHNVQVLGDVGGDLFVVGDIHGTLGYDEASGQPAALGTRSRYLATIEKIFARCPEPVERAVEFAQVTDFLTGDEPYFWWIGEPYCGKTTLAAAIAAVPPPDVVTVAFFVDRLGGTRLQDFRAAVADQLAPLAGQPRARYAEPHGFDLDDLWQLAAEGVHAAGHTLLLIVDGLDEDDSARFREPSVASQLPESCPHGSRVLVTSRQAPEVLASVSENHPLRRCAPRMLRPNEASSKSREAAVQELRHSIDDPDRVTARINRAVLGVLTAAGGHLTAADLTDLTGVDVDLYEVTQILEQTFGRLVEPRDEFGERRYVFAHDLILSEATSLLGSAVLRRYRESVSSWATRFAAEGWPDRTPTYLLDQYPRLLTEEGDTPGLLALQVPERYRALYDRFGSHHVAQQGLTDLTTFLAQAANPELAAMVRLAIWANHLRNATQAMPSDIPEGWALLGRPDKAAHLARSIADDIARIAALCSVARAYDQAGQSGDAQELLESAEFEALAFPDSPRRVNAITLVARGLADIDDHARARKLLARAFPRDEQFPAPDWDRGRVERFDRSLTMIAAVAASIGGDEMALRALAALSKRAKSGAAETVVRAAGKARNLELARQVVSAYPKHRPLLIVAARQAGDHELAAQVIDSYLESLDRQAELSKQAKIIKQAKRGKQAKSSKQAKSGKQAAGGTQQQEASALSYAMACVEAGFFGQAEQLARRVRQPNSRQRALLGIARAATTHGDTEVATRALASCAAVTGVPSAALPTIATRALRASHDSDWAQVSRLLDMAGNLAALSEEGIGPDLTSLASSVVGALADDHPDRAAERVSNMIQVARSTVGAARDSRLAGIARMAAILGMGTEAEAAASLITSPQIGDSAFYDVATAAGRKLDFDRAERITERIVDTRLRLDALRGLVVALAHAKRFDEAMELAERMPEHPLRSQAAASAAGLAMSEGFLREAESILASGIVRGPALAGKLARLAKAWIAINRPGRAGELLSRAEKYASAAPRADFLGTPPDRLLVSVQAAGGLEHVDVIATFISVPEAKARTHQARGAKVDGNGGTRPCRRGGRRLRQDRAAYHQRLQGGCHDPPDGSDRHPAPPCGSYDSRHPPGDPRPDGNAVASASLVRGAGRPASG